MPSTDPLPPRPEPALPETEDATSIVLTDTVMGGVIRESVRRQVPVTQVVAERRHEIAGPHSDNLPRPMTVAVPVRRSVWSKCLGLFRQGK